MGPVDHVAACARGIAYRRQPSPDVVGLYIDWSLPLLGRDPLTPLLLPSLHRWLSAIEDARETEATGAYRAPFTGHLDGGNLSELENNLRTGLRGVLRSNAGTGRELSRGRNGAAAQ